MRTTASWILVASALLAVPSAATELDEVLDAAGRAAGRVAWGRMESGLELRGSARMNGLETRFELFLGAEGRYRMTNDGPLGRTSGWDGSVAWERERGGPVGILNAATCDERRLPQWVHSSYWLAEGAPLAVSLVAATDESVELELASRESTTSMQLTLDPATWLPHTLTDSRKGVVYTYTDYRAVEGVLLAHRVTMRQAGVEGHVAVEVARAADPNGGARCALERELPGDVHFDGEVPPAVEVRRVVSGHLMVHPTVEGRDVGWFILDSGAGQSCIDPKVADDLELPRLGAVPAVGAGGTVTASFRQGAHFQLGPIEIDDSVYVEIDLAFLEPAFGLKVAGICGYDLFARAVLELDPEAPSLAIHDPAAFRLDAGEWATLELDDRLPCVRCEFEGDRSGLFKIDTGDAGTVSFYAPAVQSLALLEGRDVRPASVGGVGGMQRASRGELAWFTLGGHRFEAVEAIFAQSDEGAFTDTSVYGSIGGELLAPFQIVFDYTNARIALVPRKR